MANAANESFNELPCPWLRLDSQARVCAGNLALFHLLGREPEAVVGTAFDTWLTPASQVLYQSMVQPLLKLHGQVSELALSVRSAQGVAVDVLLYARSQPAGDLSMQLVVIRQRRRIESELLRIKRAADQAPGMIFQLERVDHDGWRFPYVSEAVRALFGTTAEAVGLSADSIFQCWSQEDRVTLLRQLERAAETSTAFRVVVRAVSAVHGCQPRWHEVQGHARGRGDRGQLWHGYIADVTERVAMQDAIVRRRSLEREAKARSEFIARVSHELRTPLNGIMGFAQLLAIDEAAALSSSQRDRLAVILESGRHLLSVVNQLLEVSRMESGALKLVLQPVDVSAELSHVLQLMSAAAQERGISLCVGASSGPDVAIGDPQRLRQVLLNLVSNGIKYNRPSGSVTVSTWSTSEEVGVEVADSGHGLTAEQIGQLFQPFNRLGAERTSIEGAGLGLVVCLHLVELMGGRITVRSELGTGSVFSVVLPAATAHALPGSINGLEPGDAALHDLDASIAHGRVLYVEDNPVNVLLMQALIAQRPNVSLHVAESAQAALAQAEVTKPSLLLIDLHLPDSTGVELLRELRRLPALRHVPAIVVSASAGPEAEEEALQAGFDGYWTKPLDIVHTLRSMDALLSSERSMR